MQGVPCLYPRHRIGTTAALDICSLSRDNRREEKRRLRGTNNDAERLRPILQYPPIGISADQAGS